MAELKKFLFDNFVIEDKKTKSEPEKKAQEAEAILLSEPEPEPIAEPIMTEPEPVVAVAEPEPEVIMFSEEEVAEKVKEAEQEAYNKGLKAAQESIEQTQKELLESINNKLIALIANAVKAEENAEHEAFVLARAVVDKLVPGLNFYIHPDIISYAQETIAKLANSYDFEGKIALHKDASLEKADCRVEWENGGVERNSAELGERVKDLLAEEPEGKNENE